MRTLKFGLALLASALFSTTSLARADEVECPDRLLSDHDAPRSIDRTWLYADDGRVPAPLTVVGTTSASYTQVGSDPFRVAGASVPSKYSAFDANTAQPGGMLAIGGELGLFSHVSFLALGEVALDRTSGVNGGGVAAIRVAVVSSRHLHLALSGGYLREASEGPVYDDDRAKWLPGNPGGDNGMWFQAALSGDIGRVRMVANVHGEHIFADGRDPLDVMVTLGASFRVAGAFRLGGEWVGQDLEEAFSPGAEGGARMFFGPTASLQLLRDRLTLVAGPSLGMSQTPGEAPSFLGRVAAAYGF